MAEATRGGAPCVGVAVGWPREDVPGGSGSECASAADGGADEEEEEDEEEGTVAEGAGAEERAEAEEERDAEATERVEGGDGMMQETAEGSTMPDDWGRNEKAGSRGEAVGRRGVSRQGEAGKESRRCQGPERG